MFKFTSKNVIYVVHVLVKRSKLLKLLLNCTQVHVTLGRVWSVTDQGPPAPHLTKLMSRLQRHLTYKQEIWIKYKKMYFSRNFKNPKKFWISGKTEILVFRISKKPI